MNYLSGHPCRRALVWAIFRLRSGPRAAWRRLRVFELGHPDDYDCAVQHDPGVGVSRMEGLPARTLAAISVALLVLVTSVVMLTYGNYLGDKGKPALPDEGTPVAEAAV